MTTQVSVKDARKAMGEAKAARIRAQAQETEAEAIYAGAFARDTGVRVGDKIEVRQDDEWMSARVTGFYYDCAPRMRVVWLRADGGDTKMTATVRIAPWTTLSAANWRKVEA